MKILNRSAARFLGACGIILTLIHAKVVAQEDFVLSPELVGAIAEKTSEPIHLNEAQPNWYYFSPGVILAPTFQMWIARLESSDDAVKMMKAQAESKPAAVVWEEYGDGSAYFFGGQKLSKRKARAMGFQIGDLCGLILFNESTSFELGLSVCKALESAIANVK